MEKNIKQKNRGAKPKNEENKLTERRHIAFTKEEIVKIEKEYGQSGFPSLSSYMRYKILNSSQKIN